MTFFDQCALWTGRVLLGAVCCATPLALAWILLEVIWHFVRRFVLGAGLFKEVMHVGYERWAARRKARRDAAEAEAAR